MASDESFYQGTPYSLEPTYGGFTGYRQPVSNIGLTTDPRTAFQLKEASDKLSTGVKVIEISAVSPEIMESIPQQHLKEINRLSKLTGTEMTVHGPIVEPSGLTREGWSESNREAIERQLKSAVERSHEINPDGNIRVTFHSSGLPGTEYTKEKGKEEEEEKIIVINQETGQITQVKREEKFYPETGREIASPRDELNVINRTEWSNRLLNMEHFQKQLNELYGSVNIPFVKPVLFKISLGQELTSEEKRTYEDARRKMEQVNSWINHLSAQMRGAYNEAYKYDKESRDKLEEGVKEYKKVFEEMEKIKGKLAKDPELIFRITEKRADAVGKLIESLSKAEPSLYKSLNEFAQENSAKTFANVAFSAYDKFGDKAPVVSIENPPAGMALSRADEMKKLIEGARNKFVEKAKKEGYSEGEAKRAAERLIGATWDVGHINMLRKFGFGKEELVKETEKIAPFVKHVHLSDNFGFEHTELPMGMGNVPLKEMMEKVGKEGFNVKKIIEAGNWWQHFRVPPVAETLEAFGSPIYTMKMAPYWNQAIGFQQGYFAFPSAYFPEQHFSIYGGGFSSLPQELGGQIPGKQSRTTGTPMA